jgi:TolB-like protein
MIKEEGSLMIKKIIAIFLSVLALAAFISAETSSAPEKIKIAVMEFKAMGVPQGTADSVAEIVRNELQSSGLFSMVERTALDKIMKEQSIQMSGMVDPSQAAQVGKLAGAKKLIVGSVGSLGDQTVVTIRVVDVETGTVEVGDKQVAYNQSDLVGVVEDLTRNIASKLAGRELSVGGKSYFATSSSFSEIKVTSVAASKVMISGGKDALIKEGDRLVVYIVKGNGKVQVKGLIRVRKVFDDYSECRDDKRVDGMITSSDFVRKYDKKNDKF